VLGEARAAQFQFPTDDCGAVCVPVWCVAHTTHHRITTHTQHATHRLLKKTRGRDEDSTAAAGGCVCCAAVCVFVVVWGHQPRRVVWVRGCDTARRELDWSVVCVTSGGRWVWRVVFKRNCICSSLCACAHNLRIFFLKNTSTPNIIKLSN